MSVGLFAVFYGFKESMENKEHGRDLLDVVCALIKYSNEECLYREFYTEPMLEAIRRDASDVVDIIVYWFPDATQIVDEEGHNIAQAAWKNRASKVHALIIDGNLAKHTSLSFQKAEKDHNGNNFLHFAAKSAPAKKLDLIACPPFQMQRELQWFKLAQKIVPEGRMKKNYYGETPEMVFTKEHKELVIESGDWLKKTANSVAITSILIITVVFAATISVPGGNDEHGFPNLISQPAFILFQTSIAIAGVAASLSLLLFLAILTSRLTQDDFVLRLPLTLVIGMVSLFMSAALGTLSFGAALFLLFGTHAPWTLGLVAPLIALPISLFFIFYTKFLSDFMQSTGHFLIIHAFRRLKLVGQISI